MFKEMNNEEMMMVDGGHTAWSERPENIGKDPVKVGDVIVGGTCAAVTAVTGGAALPVVATYIISTYGTTAARKAYDLDL